jgi:hypothetical protein
LGCPRHEATGTKYVLGIARWPLVLREVPGGYGGSCLVLSCIVLSCIVSSCIVLCCFVSYCIALCCIIVLMYYAMCSRMTNRASCCRKPHLRKGTTSSSVRYAVPARMTTYYLLHNVRISWDRRLTLPLASQMMAGLTSRPTCHLQSYRLLIPWPPPFPGCANMYCIVLYCVLFLC